MELSQNEFLKTYLSYVEETETPKICHLWAVLSGISACLGRRCWYPTGIGNVWPNMYIIFSGPPGGRKSSAIRYVRDLLEEVTTIRFAPDDTGGQRQGLIKAMLGNTDEVEGLTNDDLKDLIKRVGDADTLSSVGKANGHKTDLLDTLGNIKFDTRDPHSLYISASELKSFLGENNSMMMTFLLKMFDCESYTYELKNSSYKFEDGLLGIIGATTPSELSLILPPGASGAGFNSRVIFVHSSGRNRRIPEPFLNLKVRPFLLERLSLIFNEMNGAFEVTAAAKTLWRDLYMKNISLKDPRFLSYCERRFTHVQKVALSLAASRGGMIVDYQDVYLADQLLTLTEEAMPDALGEYGMNKSSVAKQKLLEYISSLEVPVATSALYSFMSRDMTRVDFENAIQELHNGKKATVLNIKDIGQCIIGVSENPARRARKEMENIRKLLEG